MSNRDVLRQQRFEQSYSPVRFLNSSAETVPAYGAMAIESIAWDEDERRIVYTIRKCTIEDEQAQNHALVMFNTHRPVPAAKHGDGTLSCPFTVLLGGPTLTAAEGEDAVPTSGVTEPVRLETVGPGRDSWMLWRGGVTHYIEFIRIKRTQRYARVDKSLSPGALIRFPNDIDGGADDQPGIGIVTLQVRNPSTNKREDAKGAGNVTMQLQVEHDGQAIDGDNNIGHAKMTSGKWAVDVKFCGDE